MCLAYRPIEAVCSWPTYQFLRDPRARFRLARRSRPDSFDPEVLCLPGGRAETDEWFQQPCERNRKRVYDWPNGGTPWSNGDLITSIHSENRPNLYIGGFWLDDAVTFAGLNALADGYDTYLLTDVSVARYPETREPAIERLIQAGVVPTTTLQIASEWMAEAHDTGMQAKLSQLIFRSLS